MHCIGACACSINLAALLATKVDGKRTEGLQQQCNARRSSTQRQKCLKPEGSEWVRAAHHCARAIRVPCTGGVLAAAGGDLSGRERERGPEWEAPANTPGKFELKEAYM